MHVKEKRNHNLMKKAHWSCW